MKFSIKSLRVNNNMTQDQVANLLGVSLRTYQSYEDNQDKLSWSQVKVLAKEFGVPVENIR